MAGAGSALDRNDYQLLEALTRQVGRLADETERLNENLENDEAMYPFGEALEARRRVKEAGEADDLSDTLDELHEHQKREGRGGDE